MVPVDIRERYELGGAVWFSTSIRSQNRSSVPSKVMFSVPSVTVTVNQ
jgi:hypothetical protein